MMPKPSEDPDPLPLPEWPSTEALNRMTADIPDAPSMTDQQRNSWDARHAAAVGRHGDGEWKTFKVSGDGLESDTREIRDSLNSIEKNTDPKNAQVSGSNDRIERHLLEIINLLRRMA